MKPGRQYKDPLGRIVTVVGTGIDASGRYVDVRLAGPYGATVRYAESCLQPLTEEEQNERYNNSLRTGRYP